MAEIKYTSDAHTDVTPIKNTVSEIEASGKMVTLGGTTNLPGAKEFVREETLICRRLKQLSRMVLLDANDTLATIADFEKSDKEMAAKLQKYSGRELCD